MRTVVLQVLSWALWVAHQLLFCGRSLSALVAISSPLPQTQATSEIKYRVLSRSHFNAQQPLRFDGEGGPLSESFTNNLC